MSSNPIQGNEVKGVRSVVGNSKLRHAPVTIYNYNWDDVIKISEHEKVRYFICQEEICPETKREHVQGYVQFTGPIKLSAARKIFPEGTHFTIPCRGTAEKNREYCSKIESRKPGGRSHEAGEINKQGKRVDLQEFKAAIDSGKSEKEVADEHFETWARHPDLFKRYKALQIEPRNREVPPDVTVITGPTGVGKTKRVFDMHNNDVYIKNETKWWDGYQGQRCILLDEFTSSTYWTIQTTLRFLDRYPFLGEVKGGHTNINSPFIVITSNMDIYTLFPFLSDEHRDALARRITRFINL